MSRFLRHTVAACAAVAAVSAPLTAPAVAAPTPGGVQTQDVGAQRAERFSDRYLRHANRGEWDWVREHSNRNIKRTTEFIPYLRSMRDHGRFGATGPCQDYPESDARTCGLTHAGGLVGEIDVRRRQDGSMVVIRWAQYQ